MIQTANSIIFLIEQKEQQKHTHYVIDDPLNFYNESVKYTKYNTTFNISKKEGINQLIMSTPSERNN